jgi:hypothetical protein
MLMCGVYVRCISTATLAGLLLIAAPLAFNASFATLAARFDYPDVLRRRSRPGDDVFAFVEDARNCLAGTTAWRVKS